MHAAPHAQQAVSQKVQATISAPTEFLTGPDVQNRYRKSQVTIWRWARDPLLNFPKPLQINRLNYWRLSDLEAWETSQQVAA